ncbi:YlbF family regulator [Angelakisella massiliensis]|uniref:YlbF family regulator n=1 Tax=Angelakisella massiliensis TaxID=1871018 RepID=UPI0008F80A88|nr:YlbF family regulator [Angelakisella massiliensis]
MDIIKMTRDLAAEMQKSDEYLAHTVARNAADNDEELQKLIGDFNLKKITLSQEVQKSEKNEERINQLNTEVRSLYNTIMANPSMLAYNTTKVELDRVLNFMQQILVSAANGEDPYTVEEETEGCTGSCSSCSGCH